MAQPSPAEVLRDRMRPFLVFLKSKLLGSDVDLDRMAQLRRLSDVRVRQFAVGRPRLTGRDLCELLCDPPSGRFDTLAEDGGLLQRGHLTTALSPLGEEMGYLIEACLTLQVAGAARIGPILKSFVAQHGKAAAPRQTTTQRIVAVSEAPLPAAIDRLLGKVRELWTIPANTLRILDMLSVPDASAEPVCAEIEKDPGLSAQCLRVVNSAAYGLGTRIASIKRAVVALGFPLTRRIVSISALVSRLGRPHDELEFDLKDFWSHSLWVAHAAALVARANRLGHPDEHFAAGLIHDIGKLVEYQYLRTPMKAILAKARAGAPYPQAERQVLGTDHAEIGACLCQRWRFPLLVVESVRHHLKAAEELEEIQVPREALVVAGMCQLSGSPPPAEEKVRAWAPLLRLPEERVAEVRVQATQLSKGCLAEILGTA